MLISSYYLGANLESHMLTYSLTYSQCLGVNIENHMVICSKCPGAHILDIWNAVVSGGSETSYSVTYSLYLGVKVLVTWYCPPISRSSDTSHMKTPS